MVGRLDGKKALITGGSSGIGLATALLFLREGAQVAFTGTNEKSIEQGKTQLKEYDANVLAIQADLSQQADIERTVATVKDKFGSLDVVFLNHGIADGKPFLETEPELLERVFKVNFFGPYLTLQKAAAIMNKPSAVILNASISGSSGMPGQTVYGATKAALRSLARTASVDLAEKGIRVNAVSPGVIETPILDKQGLSDDELQQFKDGFSQQTVLKRPGKAEEIASTVLFLATQDSSFIVGEEIFVDGGYMTT